MNLDYFTQQRLKKECVFNIVCFFYGILSNLLLFFGSQLIDQILNTFDGPLYHLIIVPCFISVFFIYLFIKFISNVKYPEGWFIIGNLIGIIPIFFLSIDIPDFQGLYGIDLIAYNLLRYFTPLIMYISTNCILYMILKLKHGVNSYFELHKDEIEQRIKETDKEYEENLKNGLFQEDDSKLIDKSRLFVEKFSDMIAKNIDPEYERKEHISDVNIDENVKVEKDIKK